MAWTNPVTVTVGQKMLAAFMNTNYTDNLNAIGPIVHIRKSADEIVNNSATLQNDDHLFFAIAASEVWIVELRLATNQASATPGLKLAWSVPAGATGHWWGASHNVGSTLQTISRVTIATSRSLGGAIGETQFSFWCVVVNSTNAGTAQFQWAQNTATVADTTMLQNSYLIAHRST